NLKDTEVMLITGYATIQGAVEAMKAGAEEYLSKPFTEEELFAAVQRALDKLNRRRAGQSAAPKPPLARHGIVGDSDAMAAVVQTILKASSTSATVLISGESGTGKELVARAIHYNSARSAAPFVAVNCAGIPETLLESELFGHVKGAFTGATESRAGFFQTADGGTLFLDEVSDTSASMQAKLLRALQEKEVSMVGARKVQKVDVRVVAATNRDLVKLVKNGTFREDLYFRLNVINIVVPPLRERGGDVLLLARHFAARFAREQGRAVPRFSDNALKVLMNYSWPGNVRELENVIQRLVVMADSDIIDIPDLPPLMRFSAPRENRFDRPLAEIEGEYIRNVLAETGGNKTRAAEILGIDRKTLRDKLKAYSPDEE
ncbi:MAG TPA: sigma-54 dependent transcriptional regulator, partial [Thermodesulfobacteriota bacterium]|nr:sigma-54 dependent transcriptional regulator [Thermodesulfobacteriota bacterium]